MTDMQFNIFYNFFNPIDSRIYKVNTKVAKYAYRLKFNSVQVIVIYIAPTDNNSPNISEKWFCGGND